MARRTARPRPCAPPAGVTLGGAVDADHPHRTPHAGTTRGYDSDATRARLADRQIHAAVIAKKRKPKTPSGQANKVPMELRSPVERTQLLALQLRAARRNTYRQDPPPGRPARPRRPPCSRPNSSTGATDGARPAAYPLNLLVQEQRRLLKGGEVPAPVEFVPVADVGEAPLGPPARRSGHLAASAARSAGVSPPNVAGSGAASGGTTRMPATCARSRRGRRDVRHGADRLDRRRSITAREEQGPGGIGDRSPRQTGPACVTTI